MSKTPEGSRDKSERKRITRKLSEAARDPSDFSIDYDERPQNVPLEGPTGRVMATLSTGKKNSLSSAVESIRKDFSFSEICNSGDFSADMDRAQMESADIVVFHEFSIAIFKNDPDQRRAVAESARSQGMMVEREYWNYPMGMPTQRTPIETLDPQTDTGSAKASLDYLRGYRDGLSRVIESLEPLAGAARGLASAADFNDSAAATWGLQATGVVGSTLNGTGVRMAVLDTGFDVTHPDFVGRSVTSESFIPATITDGSGNLITLTDRSATIVQSGHGTHCIGTACGPSNPPSGPRYGIAHGAEIFNGKVLSVIPGSPRASGTDEWIINGIRWAISNGCSIISMSFGSPVQPGDEISPAYEAIAKAAWDSGILIIAAAGNESDREGLYSPLFIRSIRPVARPANCPHIVAVAAVEPTTLSGTTLKLANFSNRHMVDGGGEINLCGPGVAVLSSFPQPRHQFLDGTSQATPHVAGIAALVQQQTGKKGEDLYLELRNRVVPQGSRLDYGNGLVHV